jgi:SAM-dependent methyltransferase
MTFRDRYLAGLARQLGRPEGIVGRAVGSILNRGNRAAVLAAIDATGLGPGQRGADIGFGGGLGLRTLLDRVGADGHVDGVELSTTMLDRAGSRHRSELASGRLTLQPGTLGELPLQDRVVDGLVTVNTLYFVDDVEAVYRELARVLRPGGRAVVGVGDVAAMARMPFTAHGFRLRPAEAVADGLRTAGLDVQHDRVGKGDRAFHLLIGSQPR